MKTDKKISLLSKTIYCYVFLTLTMFGQTMSVNANPSTVSIFLKQILHFFSRAHEVAGIRPLWETMRVVTAADEARVALDILRKNSNSEGFYKKPLRERVEECGYSLELAQILIYDEDKILPALLRLKLAAIIIKILGNPLNAENAGVHYYKDFLDCIEELLKDDRCLDIPDIEFTYELLNLLIITSETNFTYSSFDVSRRAELINHFIKKYINTKFNKPLLARLVVCALNGPYAMNLINFEYENIMNLITHYGFTIDAEDRIPGFIRAQLAIALFAHKIPMNENILFTIRFLILDRETYNDLTPEMRAQLLIGLVTQKPTTENWAREQAEFLLNKIVDNDLRRELTNIINGNPGDEPIAMVARIEPVVAATPHRVNHIADLLPELRQLGAPEMRAQVDNNLRRELTNIINENPGDEPVAVVARIEPATIATPSVNRISFLLAEVRELGVNVYELPEAEDFLDPITYTVMEDPIDAGDGHIYDRNSLLNYFHQDKNKNKTSIESIYTGCGTINLQHVQTAQTNLYIRGKIIEFLEKLIKAKKPKEALEKKESQEGDKPDNASQQAAITPLVTRVADTLNTLRGRTIHALSPVNNMLGLLTLDDMYTNIMTLGIDELDGLSRDDLLLINSLREVDQRNNDRAATRASTCTSSSSSIQRYIFTDAEIEEKLKK